jgi:hypothetical protein
MPVTPGANRDPMKDVRAAALAAFLAFALAGCSADLVVAEGTPSDLTEVVQAAMDEIQEAMPSQADCLQGVTVTHDRELGRRAEYRPESGTVVLRVPATAADLTFSLAHEVAHHLEVSCPRHEEMRPAFLAAQGFEADQPWFDGVSWATTPSEQYATAVAQLVTGHSDQQRRLVISDEALLVIEQWAAGDETGFRPMGNDE